MKPSLRFIKAIACIVYLSLLYHLFCKDLKTILDQEFLYKDKLPPTYVEGFHDLEAIKLMEYKILGKTGLQVSKLSLGGAPFGYHYGSFNEEEGIKTIIEAIKKGINYIDTAYFYGQGKSEKIIGKALQQIPRRAYYIATKVGRYELDYRHMFDFTASNTRKSFQKSLDRLQLPYVDIIQVHDIEFAPSLDIIVTQTLPELSRIVAEGRARHIGITGYPVSILKKCIEKSNVDIACVLSYARCTLIDNTLTEYIAFFKERNIGIINAAAACMGLLSSREVQKWHPANDEMKKICKEAEQYCKENTIELAKLAVWYPFQFEDITTHLVGMQNSRELNIGLDVVNNGITMKEKNLLNEIKETYLSKIIVKHWEGVELKQYWNAMKF